MKTFRIRLYTSDGNSRYHRQTEGAGEYCFAEYTSFRMVPAEVIQGAEWMEVRADVPDNSYNLGVSSNDAQADSTQVEIVATGQHVVFTGVSFDMVKLAFDAYFRGLGESLAKREGRPY